MERSSCDSIRKSSENLLGEASSEKGVGERSHREWSVNIAHWILTILAVFSNIILLIQLLQRDECQTPSPVSQRYQRFVPDDILTSTETFNYGYYIDDVIPPDIFQNISVLEQRLEEMGMIHFSTGVLVNGDYKTWHGGDGQEHFLYPKLGPRGEEAYPIAAFHQMHCLMETLRDYGYLLNGYQPKWNDHHTLHCFNLFYRVITCLSDSSVEAYKDPQTSVRPPGGVRRASETADGPRCRDFKALRQWALDPIRAIPFSYDSGHDESRIKLPERCDLRQCRNADGWLDGTNE